MLGWYRAAMMNAMRQTELRGHPEIDIAILALGLLETAEGEAILAQLEIGPEQATEALKRLIPVYDVPIRSAAAERSARARRLQLSRKVAVVVDHVKRNGLLHVRERAPVELLRALLEADAALQIVLEPVGITSERLRSVARVPITTGDEPTRAATSGFMAQTKSDVGSATAAPATDRPVWYLRIEADSETPLYEQIIQRVQEAIANGDLEDGERLPAVRQLADELGIAPGTVARAYSALEERRFVVTEGARGTRVAPRSMRASETAAVADLMQMMLPVIMRAYQTGVSESDLRDAVDRVIKPVFVKA